MTVNSLHPHLVGVTGGAARHGEKFGAQLAHLGHVGAWCRWFGGAHTQGRGIVVEAPFDLFGHTVEELAHDGGHLLASQLDQSVLRDLVVHALQVRSPHGSRAVDLAPQVGLNGTCIVQCLLQGLTSRDAQFLAHLGCVARDLAGLGDRIVGGHLNLLVEQVAEVRRTHLRGCGDGCGVTCLGQQGDLPAHHVVSGLGVLCGLLAELLVDQRDVLLHGADRRGAGLLCSGER